MVLGCFANFAQNDYGLTMIGVTYLIISLIFFTEAIYYFKINIGSKKWIAFYHLSEYFCIGLFFLGSYCKLWHLPGAGVMLVVGSGILAIQYVVFAVRVLLTDLKKGKLITIMVFFFMIAALLAFVGLTFKTQHWPGAWWMLNFTVGVSAIFLLASILKRTYDYNGTSISLYKRLMLLPGKPVMIFTYSVIWLIYIRLIVFGVVPDFYFSTTPPAYENLRQQNQNAKAETYLHGYQEFCEERENAAKQH